MNDFFLLESHIYIYIIYTPNLGSSAFVLDPEREQSRFNQAREKTAKESRKNKKKTKKNNEKTQKKNTEIRFDFQL